MHVILVILYETKNGFIKFELTACELDKDYYEAGKKRLKQHQSQLTIF